MFYSVSELKLTWVNKNQTKIEIVRPKKFPTDKKNTIYTVVGEVRKNTNCEIPENSRRKEVELKNTDLRYWNPRLKFQKLGACVGESVGIEKSRERERERIEVRQRVGLGN